MIRRSSPRTSRSPQPTRLWVELLEARDVPSGFSLDGRTFQPSPDTLTITLVEAQQSASVEAGVHLEFGDKGDVNVEGRYHDSGNGRHSGDDRDGDEDRFDHDDDRDDKGAWKDKDKGDKDKGGKDKDDGNSDEGHPADKGPPADRGQGGTGNPKQRSVDTARPGDDLGDGNDAPPPRPRGEDSAEGVVGILPAFEPTPQQPPTGSGESTEHSSAEGDAPRSAAPDGAAGTPSLPVSPDLSSAPPDKTGGQATPPAAQNAPGPGKHQADLAETRTADATTPSLAQTVGVRMPADDVLIYPCAWRAGYIQASELPGRYMSEAMPLLLEADVRAEQTEPTPHAAGLLQELVPSDLAALDGAFGQFLGQLGTPEAADGWLVRLGPWFAAGAAGAGLAAELARRHLRNTRRNLLRAAGPDGVSLTWFPELGSALE